MNPLVIVFSFKDHAVTQLHSVHISPRYLSDKTLSLAKDKIRAWLYIYHVDEQCASLFFSDPDSERCFAVLIFPVPGERIQNSLCNVNYASL
jgi:hypothetical protein